MWFAIDDKHLIKWMWEKNYTEKKRLLKMSFWQKMKSWLSKDTD